MKKILLATTMLAGTAGFAAAEGVTMSGYAEMGIFSDNAGDVSFWQDVEVKFNMTGTTDGGLEFGAEIDLDEGAPNINELNGNGTYVYLNGAFGNITMGDTDGAIDWAIADTGTLTSLADDHTTHVAQFSFAQGLDGRGDGQVVRYDNTFGAFGFAVSAEQEDDGAGLAVGGVSGVASNDILGIGLKYTADLGGTALNVGLAYQTGNDDAPFTALGTDENVDVWGASVSAELAGGFSGTLGYLAYDYDDAGVMDYDHMSIGLNYTTGALAMNFNYGDMSPDVGPSMDSWGMAVNYDLGGGAVVMAGYGSDTDVTTAGDQDQWSLGLGMSF